MICSARSRRSSSEGGVLPRTEQPSQAAGWPRTIQGSTLNEFLASVELRAFKIAQLTLRHEEDALDVVQDAMRQLLEPTGGRPQDEWKPLFYRILENRIRDVQRRRTVRNRVIAWLPFRKGDEDDPLPDPVEQAASLDPTPGIGSRSMRPWALWSRPLQPSRPASGKPSCCEPSKEWTSPKLPRRWVARKAASRHITSGGAHHCALSLEISGHERRRSAGRIRAARESCAG